MIRKFIKSGVFILLLFFVFQAQAQILHPVKWKWQAKKVSKTEVDLIFTATIKSPWHVYALEPVKNGPIPTSFNFTKSSNYQLVGKTKEGKPIKEKEPVFNNAIVSYYNGSATFTQRIQVKSAKDFKLKGYLEFMTCNDHQCLPPSDIDFSFNIKGVSQTNLASTQATKKNGQSNQSGFGSPSGGFNVSLGQSSSGGIVHPVTWTITKRQINDTIYQAVFTANIESGWHIYGNNIADTLGPIPTSFHFDSTNAWLKIGKMQYSVQPLTKHDPVFDAVISTFNNKVAFTQNFKVLQNNASVKGHITYMACNDKNCIPPQTKDFDIHFSNTKTTVSAVNNGSSATIDNVGGNKKHKSLWGFFWACVLGGLFALLSPCIYSMIPLTVSYFTKQSKTKAQGIKNAILYAICIIVIYVLLGVVISAIFGSSALNKFATNVYFNIVLFILFALFAVSFLGAFELTLPSSWINKADKMSGKGGIVGIFFMALVLALVSFSCTAPVVGSILGLSATVGGIGPVVGMLGFSIALALPFAIFAAFPGWMNSLPKSGGWLNVVKVFLGFIELALAFKFLSNADLVVQAHILTREVFLAIWIAIFGALALYLFGFIHLTGDGEQKPLSTGRLMMALLSLAFTVYLIPGMWGAPLKLVSGFTPSQTYAESPDGVGKGGGFAAVSSATKAAVPKGADPKDSPYHLNAFRDYKTGMAYAKKVHKPVMLDFTGFACINCRKMEQYVWSDPKVLDILRNKVVVISLYVDYKKELPDSEKKTVKIGDYTQHLRTVGDKWSYFEASHYNQNTQPLYVLVDNNGNKLADTYSYDPSVQKFLNWLNSGIEKYKKKENS